ncbi:M20 metallopeptidase family protein [Leucobacter sp. HY1910]
MTHDTAHETALETAPDTPLEIAQLTARLARHCAELQPGLARLRRSLHQIPEIGLELPKTQQLLLDELAAMPELEVSVGEQLSSIIVVLRGGNAERADGTRPAVLLRGDMDALPVHEDTGESFSSRIDGAMHACGHDLHMAALFGAVQSLYQERAALRSDVVFMFQPGEEGLGGAKLMIEEGVLDAAGPRVSAAYGLHVFSANMDQGVFYLRPGTLMASANTVDIEFRGAGGHGSTPHSAKDPIPAACESVLALQTLVTREFDIFDPVVINVGVVDAGTAPNVIPERANCGVSVRSYSPAARERVLRRIGEVARGIASAHNLEVSIAVDEGYPVTRNNAHETERAKHELTGLFGAERVTQMRDPLPGSEDFSFVLDEVPGSFLLLGTGAPGSIPHESPLNHSPHAVFDDSYLGDAATALAALAATFDAGVGAEPDARSLDHV